MSTSAEQSSEPYVCRSRDGAFHFTLGTPKLTVYRELAVTETHEDPDLAPLQVTSGGVVFSATVTLAGPSPHEWGRVGWIQTIEPGSQSVTYQNGEDSATRGDMVRRNDVRMRDGDPPEGDAAPLWYDAAGSCEPIKPGEAVQVSMDDRPNVAFHPRYNGTAAPWIKGWRAVAAAGTMSFNTWLIAHGGADNEIVYLYHVHWAADFGTGLREGALDAPTGGFSIISHGPGKGGQEPCFDRNPIDEKNCPWTPDTSLLGRKPAFAPAKPAAAGGTRVVMGSRPAARGGKQPAQPQPGQSPPGESNS